MDTETGQLGRCRVLFVMLCVLALLAPAARAQQGHGWFVLDAPSKETAKRATVIHLAPPDRLSPPGTVRVVQGLTRVPDRLAWAGNTLFILMPAEQIAASEMARRVYSISTTPGLMPGWEYIPPDRPEALATIAGKWGARDLEVVGFGAASAAPVVLMQRAGGGGAYLLLILAGTEWIEATLPWEGSPTDVPALADKCRLITAGLSFGILVEHAAHGDGTWYVASTEDLAAVPMDSLALDSTMPSQIKLRWTPRKVQVDPPLHSARGSSAPGQDMVYCVEDQLVRLSLAGGDATLSVLQGGKEYVVTTMTGVGANVRVAPVEGNPGFLALLSATSVPAKGEAGTPEKPAKTETVYRLLEVTPGGRVLYDGPAKQGGPVSIREIQLLSVLLVMVMAAVVVFVLRPDRALPSNGIKLPPGCIPAETGRRVMSTILDLGASWVVASLVVRLDLADLARPDVLLGSPRGWHAALTALLVTMGLGMVMEWQFGMTLGKMLLGCRVLAVHQAPVQPQEGAEERGEEGGKQLQAVGREGLTFRAAAWRNVGKWMPWNVVEILATGRHRPWADRVSGTMVVALDGSDQEEPDGQ